MFDRLARWLRRPVTGFPTGDLVLAGALCVIAVASVLSDNPYEGPVYITLPVAIVTTVSLAWRVRAPAVSVLMVVTAEIAQTFTAHTPSSLWALVVEIIVVYSIAAHYPEGRAAIGGLMMVGSSMLQERVDNGVDYLFITVLFGGTWLLGRASRLWRTRISHAEQHQYDLARIAVTQERLHIAREPHDVVAHSLSIIAVQVDAAAALAHDPALAREPLRAINMSARGSLREIRDMLELLRSGDEMDAGGAALRPTPGLGTIEELIADAGKAGLTVQSSIEGERFAVPRSVDLAAYRIVQETLTNVAKYAEPVAATVVIRRSAECVELEVSNEPGQAGPKVASAGVGLVVDLVGPVVEMLRQVVVGVPAQTHPGRMIGHQLDRLVDPLRSRSSWARSRAG